MIELEPNAKLPVRVIPDENTLPKYELLETVSIVVDAWFRFVCSWNVVDAEKVLLFVNVLAEYVLGIVVDELIYELPFVFIQ